MGMAGLAPCDNFRWTGRDFDFRWRGRGRSRWQALRLFELDQRVARIFSILAIFAVLLLAANFVVGLVGGDFNAVARNKREAHNRLIELERQSRASRNEKSPELEQAKSAAAAADAEFRGPRSRMTLHML